MCWRRKWRWMASVGLFVGYGFVGGEARAVEWKCPAETDIAYVVRDEQTLSEVAQKTYCVTTEPSVSQVWNGLHQYNKFAVGDKPNVFKDLVLCLPAHFTGVNWYANRCVNEEPPTSPVCGNGKREEGEVCDGADVGIANCAALGLGSGQVACQANCKVIDVSACGPVVTERDPIGPEDPGPAGEGKTIICAYPGRTLNKPLPRLSRWIDVALGGTIPLQSSTWTHMHRALGNVRVGARFDVAWFQLAPRVHFLMGRDAIRFNDALQDQTLLGGGASLEWGVPWQHGLMRVTPGISAGLMYLQAFWKENPDDAPWGVMPVGSVFIRPEWRLGAESAWSVTMDVGGEVMFYKLHNVGIEANVNARVMGGVSHVF